jgi:hypothetical protein
VVEGRRGGASSSPGLVDMTIEPTTLVHAAGWFNLTAAVFHLGFWRLFRWPQSLGDLNHVNRGTLYTMNWALTYLFGLLAIVFLCADFASARVGTMSWLLLGMSGFYMLRAAAQPYYFRLKHPLSVTVFVFAVIAAVLHFMAFRALSGS